MRVTTIIFALASLASFGSAARADNVLRAARRFAVQVSRGKAEPYRIADEGSQRRFSRDGMTATIQRPDAVHAFGPPGQIGQVQAGHAGWRHDVTVDTPTKNGFTSRVFAIPVSSLNDSRGVPRQTASFSSVVSSKSKVLWSIRFAAIEGLAIGKSAPMSRVLPWDPQLILSRSLRAR
jgi:hypothetical protein